MEERIQVRNARNVYLYTREISYMWFHRFSRYRLNALKAATGKRLDCSYVIVDHS